MDIFESLNDIPALRAFNAEPVTLDLVPAGQRVREFLAGIFGPTWYAARVLQYATAKGEEIYAAFGPMPDFAPGSVMHLVCERADGVLSLAAPVDLAEEDTADGRPGNITILPPRTTGDESCLSLILPALRDARRIVAKADISDKRKARILAQLVHAQQHLAE